MPPRRISAHGLSCDLLPGWDIRIERREQSEIPVPGSTEPMGGYTHPILQAGTSALPARRGDYGSGYVERMTQRDVFFCLGEFDRSDGAHQMFEDGMPSPLRGRDFHPDAQQRVIAGMCGAQRFFAVDGRAFCLYVVLGSWLHRSALVPRANQLLSSIRIEPQ